MMTVGDLVKALQQEDQSAIVVLSADPEGNGFRVVDDYPIEKGRISSTGPEAAAAVSIWPGMAVEWKGCSA